LVIKRAVASVLDRAGLLDADERRRGSRTVIAINYHATPAQDEARLREHFSYYRERFECLAEDSLMEFLLGSRVLSRTGVVICFDDGHRDNAEVAARLLEEYGLRGWFMLPGAFLDADEPLQPEYFARHIRPSPRAGDVPTFAMSWHDARALVRQGHTIGCHTWSHQPLGSSSQGMAEEETIRAKQLLEDRLGSRVRTFCWVRGRVEDHSPQAHRYVVRAYDLAFTSMGHAIRPRNDPHTLHRFNVESTYDLRLVRLQISSVIEASSARRRALIHRALGLR
jgi:peptidoglycan/xylan/chitin deacetylase (PgdA/CDA1 family)